MTTADKVVVELEARLDRYQSDVKAAEKTFVDSMNKTTGAATAMETAVTNTAAKAGKGLAVVGSSAQKADKQVKSLAGQTGNLASQFNDIAVQLASGTSPFLVAIQQGTQINQVLGSAGAAGAASALGGALLSLVNPVSLATIGIIGLGGAAVQYLGGLDGDIKTVDEVLKEHAALIRDIKDAYGEASVAAEEYTRKSKSELEAQAADALASAKATAADASEAFLKSVTEVRLALVNGQAQNVIGVADQFQPFASAIEKLRQEIAAGKPDFAAFREEIDRIAASDPENLTQYRNEILTLAQNATNADRALAAAAGGIDAVGKAASGQVQLVAELTDALKTLADVAAQLPTDQEIADAAYKKAISAARTPGERAAADAAYLAAQDRIAGANAPIPQRKPNTLNQGFDGTTPTRASNRATASDQFERSLQAVRDRTEALRLETETVGLSNAASERKQIALALEQKALADLREEARRKGETDLASIQLSPQQVRAIDDVAAAYARQSEIYKSVTEQQQRIDEASQEAWSSIKGGILDVISGASSLQEALAGVLEKLAEIAASNALDALFQPSSGGSSGGALGGIIGFLGKLLGGGFAAGGYTGGGGRNQPAGVVHGGEFVFSKAATDRAGVGALSALHRSLKGYAGGGFVGMPATPTGRFGGGASTINEHYNIAVTVAGTGDKELQAGLTKAVNVAVETSRRSLPKWQSDYATHRG